MRIGTMLRSHVLFLLLGTLLPSSTFAQIRRQDSGSSELAALAAVLPTCGLDCVEEGLATSNCTTAECMCADASLLASVTLCVEESCSLINQLTVKNVTDTTCGVPVRDAGTSYNILNITLGCVSAAVMLLRISYKLLIAKIPLGMDDIMIFMTVISGIPSTVITSLGTIAHGLGKDIWTLSPTEITKFVYWFYFMEWLYFLDLGFMKLSLLFFYLKIFPKKSVKIVIWVTIGFTVVWAITFALVAALSCNPISYYWTNWDGEHSGTCLNTNAIGWANAISSIAEDIWMLAIPLWQLRNLQLHFKKKVGVAIMFFTGTFVTVISIIRLDSLITFSNSQNPTWDNLRVSQWSTIEVNVGIICACMPTLRLILLRLFPSLSSTTRKYGTNGSFVGDKYASNSRRNQSQVRGGPNSTMNSNGGAHNGSSSRHNNGITYERSYTVHYHDAETSSQVQLKDLDVKGFDVASNISECSA